MALHIRRTGYEDFISGEHNIQALVIGSPGAGKTLMGSSWPRPIYADCENGRASLASRHVPYVEIHSSKDMLDLLSYLKGLERIPKAEREYQTVVIDTIDGYQRSVKDEWITKNQAQEFKGYEAWGYLDARMNMLMTRLLNLDYNVLVLSHFKQSTSRSANGEESTNIALQLDGKVKDTIYNDFDLVGRLGTYWEAEGGERVERRGLTFKATPEWPFLKDRMGVTPAWMPVTFEESDFTQVLDVIMAKAAEIGRGEDIGVVPDADAPVPSQNVVAPMDGGPVAVLPDIPEDDDLGALSKQDLVEKAKSLGCDVRGNMLKADIIALIKAAKAAPALVDAPEVAVASPETEIQEEVAEAVVEAPAPEAEPAPAPSPASVTDPRDATHCADCGTDLSEATPDFVKLSFIKFRRRLCDDCYQLAKNTK